MTSKPEVAIVGAGPAGLVAARYLLAHGFEPVLFEQRNSLGGQWNTGGAHSGIWPAMVTNTSWITTQFSDLSWPAGTAMFPHNREVAAYLRRYSDRFDITRRIRLGKRVERIETGGAGAWRVSSTSQNNGSARTETFPYVIVASGRYCAPKTAEIPGLESFSGEIAHTFAYRGPEAYRGQRVLVAGCSISAVEIAPELAMGGAARVLSSMRRQRYVLQRIVEGVPIDLLAFTRAGVLAGERLPREMVSAQFRQFIERTSGSPERWGGLPADPDPFVAGITQGQFYLPLVAERRILPKPWMASVRGRRVSFADGTEEEVDAILFGTGFRIHLPFLEERIRTLTGADGPALKLYRHTFHPRLPGLAFLGLFHQSGPYFPVLELQARWIAYSWSGLCRPVSPEEMTEELDRMGIPNGRPGMMSERSVSFARDAGVEPDPAQWPELKRALLFGPLAPVSFRLSGPDRLPDAAERLAEEAAEFGVVPSRDLTLEQREMLESLGMV